MEELEEEEETGRDSLICWFILQMSSATRAGQAECRNLELYPGLPRGREGHNRLGCHLMPSQMSYQGDGWELEQPGLEPGSAWDAGVGAAGSRCLPLDTD